MLDAGDALVRKRGWSRSPEDAAKEKPTHLARADLILRYYQQVKVQAMALGPEDLLLGLDEITKLIKKTKAPMLAASIQDASGKKVLPGSLVAQAGEWKIGILAVAWPQRHQEVQLKDKKVSFADPVEAARKEVQSLKKLGATLIIMLSAADQGKTEQIMKAVPEINLAIVSGGGWMRKPRAVDDRYIVGIPPGGKHMGVLELSFIKDSVKITDISERYDLLAQAQRSVRSWKMTRQMMSRQPEQSRSRFDFRIASMERSFKGVAARFETANKEIPSGSYMANRVVDLNADVGEDPDVKKMVEEVKKAHDIDDLKRRPFKGRLPLGAGRRRLAPGRNMFNRLRGVGRRGGRTTKAARPK